MPQDNEWLPQDAAATREFLNSPTGQKLFHNLEQSISTKDGTSIEEEALNSRETKGGFRLLSQLLTFANEQPEQPPGIKFFNAADVVPQRS